MSPNTWGFFAGRKFRASQARTKLGGRLKNFPISINTDCLEAELGSLWTCSSTYLLCVISARYMYIIQTYKVYEYICIYFHIFIIIRYCIWSSVLWEFISVRSALPPVVSVWCASRCATSSTPSKPAGCASQLDLGDLWVPTRVLALPWWTSLGELLREISLKPLGFHVKLRLWVFCLYSVLRYPSC